VFECLWWLLGGRFVVLCCCGCGAVWCRAAMAASELCALHSCGGFEDVHREVFTSNGQLPCLVCVAALRNARTAARVNVATTKVNHVHLARFPEAFGARPVEVLGVTAVCTSWCVCLPPRCAHPPRTACSDRAATRPPLCCACGRRRVDAKRPRRATDEFWAWLLARPDGESAIRLDADEGRPDIVENRLCTTCYSAWQRSGGPAGRRPAKRSRMVHTDTITPPRTAMTRACTHSHGTRCTQRLLGCVVALVVVLRACVAFFPVFVHSHHARDIV